MRALVISFFFLVAVGQMVLAQQTIYDETTILYKKELQAGIMIHGDGWGLNFTHAKYKTAKNRRTLGVEVVSMKHPKEVKSFNPYYEDSRGYFYGKVNSMLVLRPTYGRKKLITDKIRKGGVEVNYLWSIGPSIGLVKPVYLQIGKPDLPYETIVVEQYDPEIHFVDDIFGRASWFKGVGQMNFYPGAFGRLGMNFEYAGETTMIKALEVGASLDVYPAKIPLMAEREGVDNKQFFLEFYLSVQLGKKYIR